MTVRVQAEDFDVGVELKTLSQERNDIGAVVSFSGLVRDDTGDLLALELEHYPGMTQAALTDLEAKAFARWDLSACLIIHRYGKLDAGAQIMMVATASVHRRDAFEAAQYLMDFLKTDAPFWKKEHLKSGTRWVAQATSDTDAKKRW